MDRGQSSLIVFHFKTVRASNRTGKSLSLYKVTQNIIDVTTYKTSEARTS